MINTIFYFPDSLTFDQYLNKLDQNSDDGIASRTIVLAKQLGKIYNNGRVYGTNVSDVQQLIEQNEYDDQYVTEAIETLQRNLSNNSEAINLQGLQFTALTNRVKTIEDNGYVSEQQILTALAGEIDGSTQKSSVRNKINNLAKEASSSLFTEVYDSNHNITAQSIVDAIVNDNSARAELASHFTAGDNSMWSGVLTEADLNTATSSLFVALSNKANDNEVVKKASIIASINNSGESGVSINADKINLNGNVIAARLLAASAVIGGFTIGQDELIGTSGTNQLTLGPNSGITLTTNSGNNTSFTLNLDGSGYLANGALLWSNNGGLDITADGLMLDVEHSWPWWPNTQLKGLGALCIVGDYSNVHTKARWNYDTQQWVYESLRDLQDYESDAKSTKEFSNAMTGAICDASGLGIVLFNPLVVDLTGLNYNRGDALPSGASGTVFVEDGMNMIHPCVRLFAGAFTDYEREFIGGTQGLVVEGSQKITGGLHVRDGLMVSDKVYSEGIDSIGPLYVKAGSQNSLRYVYSNGNSIAVKDDATEDNWKDVTITPNSIDYGQDGLTIHTSFANEIDIQFSDNPTYHAIFNGSSFAMRQSGDAAIINPDSILFLNSNNDTALIGLNSSGLVTDSDLTVDGSIRMNVANGQYIDRRIIINDASDGSMFVASSSGIVASKGSYSTSLGKNYVEVNYSDSNSDQHQGNLLYNCLEFVKSGTSAQLSYDDTNDKFVFDKPVDVTGILTATNVSSSSDETLKDKVADVELTAEQIAEAPAIKYIWKDKEKDQNIHVGTIAQYWQDILPEVVNTDSNEKLTLDYQGAAMAAVINLAKEVVELKAKIAELESKLTL